MDKEGKGILGRASGILQYLREIRGDQILLSVEGITRD